MNDYNSIRSNYISNPQWIIETEKKYFDIILNGIKEKYLDIKKDFNDASKLESFWKKYAPKQRGNKPKDDAYPWGEVGEKVLDAYTYQLVLENFDGVRFTGLPYGHDTRFVTEDAFVQLDIKSTGPNDDHDEVVSSPNQVTGDGLKMDDSGITNSKVTVQGPRKSIEFQPELPPFYVIDNVPKITLTYYLKCIYEVIRKGYQPISYLELISVPNGLIMFDTLRYYQKRGLLTPGKDEQTFAHKRTRIKLDPLSKLASWRCVKIFEKNGKIITKERADVKTTAHLFP